MAVVQGPVRGQSREQSFSKYAYNEPVKSESAGGNVVHLYESSLAGGSITIDGLGGHNYIFNSSVDGASIIIRGAGANYIFQGSIESTDILVETMGNNNLIFQGSVNNVALRVGGTGGSMCTFQRAVNNSVIKDRGDFVDSKFVFSGTNVNTLVSYRDGTYDDNQR